MVSTRYTPKGTLAGDFLLLAYCPLGEFCSGLSLCDTLSTTLLNLLVGVASEVDQLLDLGGCYLWAPVVNSHCRFCDYLLWVYTLLPLLPIVTLP